MNWEMGIGIYTIDSMYKADKQWEPQFNSVAQSCLTLCDPMDRSTPHLPAHHQLPESTQAHVHGVDV